MHASDTLTRSFACCKFVAYLFIRVKIALFQLCSSVVNKKNLKAMQTFAFCLKCTKIQWNDILKTVSIFKPKSNVVR